MLDSARHTFHAWTRAEVMNRKKHRRLVNVTIASPNPTMDALGVFVRASGYLAGEMSCPLLARKFPTGTREAVLKALFDCEGGGLSETCMHPHARHLQAAG